MKLDRAVWGGVEPETPMWGTVISLRYLTSAHTADMDKC